MAPQRRRARYRPALTAAGITVAAVLAAGPAPSPVPPAPAPRAPTAAPTATSAPAAPRVSASPGAAKGAAGITPFGAFLDSGPLGVTLMAGLRHWLGGTEPKVAHTYLPGGRWADVEGPPGFLDPWARWRRAQADRTLVLNVPMQERNEENLSDDEVRELLRRGAAGEFDRHFRTLAERLVESGVPDTVLVLGWEMNGITYTHRCGPDPASWKTYWKRIVATMRSVPGQRFRFDFTPSRGRDAVPWTECYPGDDTVDIIGMDAYDQPAGLSFAEQVREPYGLRQHVDFAKAHGKPVSYPEWGLFRNGDDTDYMRGMLAWIREHGPVYNTLTDYCPHGVWQCARNPRSSQVYRSFLYGRGEQQPAPAATVSAPAPEPGKSGGPAPEPGGDCPVPDPDDWSAYRLGRKSCPDR
ncbi:glycoside hydrolase family 26 protein [Streptomyces sp. NPDC059168]|uniref:glycoside hydrolase family 26 protein n=1 Tax=Streptomyces sp. NPDC059168 TaxID=3346753 RepID=UPI00367D52AC